MAGFRTHITVSTALGIGYGAAAHFWYGFPPATCALGASLCAASGMLPDLDSDSGRPLREMITLTASLVPMLLIHRFQEWHMTHDGIALAGIATYLGIRFGLAAVLKRLTVHRGMFHSIPACLIAGELAFLLCESDTLDVRYFKAAAVMLGFMSHLVLDEIWSIEFKRGLVHLKSSSGTALKFWGDQTWPNLFTYACVGVLSFLAVNDPLWMEKTIEQQWQGGQAVEQMAGRESDATAR